VQALCIRVPSTLDFSDAPPVDLRGIPVLLVARDNATLAADALRHVEVKAVLFAKFQGSLGNSSGSVRSGIIAVGSFARDAKPAR